MDIMISFCELTFTHATVAPRMGKYRLLYAVNALVYNTSRRLSRVYLPCTNLLHRPVVSNSASRNGEFSQLWELLGAHREKKLWGIPHGNYGEFYIHQFHSNVLSK